MRKIIVGAFVSLDGVMQAPGGPQEDPTGGFALGGWVAPHFDEALQAIVGETFAKPFDLLLGRKTYEIFAAHWPYVAPDDPVGPMFTKITKFVATRNPDFELGWQNSVALGPDAMSAVARLKTEDGPDLLTQGSSDFLQSLFKHDLVDELNLMTAPTVLGKGKRLFGDHLSPAAWRLIRNSSTPKGVVFSGYRRAGEFVSGSFQLEQPTEAELKRRANLK